jgi:hypothetical protein
VIVSALTGKSIYGRCPATVLAASRPMGQVPQAAAAAGPAVPVGPAAAADGPTMAAGPTATAGPAAAGAVGPTLAAAGPAAAEPTAAAGLGRAGFMIAGMFKCKLSCITLILSNIELQITLLFDFAG